MITTPFNLLNLQNLSLLSDTSIKEHQDFAKDLMVEMNKSTQREIFSDYSLKSKDNLYQMKILSWFSNLTNEEKIKVCTIKSKWLVEALYQMYLLFKKDNKIAFEPSDEMLIFLRNERDSNDCNGLDSSNSFNLLDNEPSSNEKEGKENIPRTQIINENDADSSLYFKPCENNEINGNSKDSDDFQNMENNFLNHINILSSNDSDEFDIVAIDLKLLSDVEFFKRCFKLFTNDNYFKDWIVAFENQKGIKNFYLPAWMGKKCNLKFGFCEIIVAFLEQNILLNYEYYYFTNKIYEVSYNKKDISYYAKINLDNTNNKLINIFNYLFNINNNNIEQNTKNKNNNKINNIYDTYEKNKINKINEINKKYKKNQKNKLDNDNDELKRIISRNSISTTKISYYQTEEDSFSIISDKSKVTSKTNNSNNNSINSFNYYKYSYFNFDNMINSYYEQGILNYFQIVNNNLKIFNKIQNKYLSEIQSFIKENLRDKYDISFGYYGSHFTGLDIEGSDLDIFVLYNQKDKNNNLNFRDELFNMIKHKNPFYCPFKLPDDADLSLIVLNIDIYDEIKYDKIFNPFNYIDFAEISKLKVDLFYNNNEENLKYCKKVVEFVKNSINSYPQIKPVILFIKRYIKNIRMNKVFKGGISSYSIFLIVLNAVKSLELYTKKTEIGISQLLFYVLHKFSVFDFQVYGIDMDNYDYRLKEENLEENLYILDPINGKNVAMGKCKGGKLRMVFKNAYDLFYKEINYFTYLFRCGYNPFTKNPIISINSIFQSKINYYE